MTTSPAPKLTLNREHPCPRCGFPLVVEWTCMGGPDGPTHVYCKGPGDSLDVLRSFDQLGPEDQTYLLAMMENDA